jgi:hypothetical protein
VDPIQGTCGAPPVTGPAALALENPNVVLPPRQDQCFGVLGEVLIVALTQALHWCTTCRCVVVRYRDSDLNRGSPRLCNAPLIPIKVSEKLLLATSPGLPHPECSMCPYHREICAMYALDKDISNRVLHFSSCLKNPGTRLALQ